MQYYADCHVHIYPKYVLSKLLTTAFGRLVPTVNTQGILCLTERADCNVFPSLITLINQLGDYISEQVDSGCIKVTRISDNKVLLIFAGFQIATAEKLEVLDLVSTYRVPNGLPLHKTIAAVKAHDGVAVLNWAPGKWVGRRGALILEAIKANSCSDVLMCDTTLRPIGWPNPAAFKLAKEFGYRIILGSDPLPQDNEEYLVGSYGISFKANLLTDSPSGELRRLFLDQTFKFEQVGARPNPLSWLIRYAKYMLGKKVL